MRAFYASLPHLKISGCLSHEQPGNSRYWQPVYFRTRMHLHKMLARLTNHFENDPHSPAAVHNMDENYVRNMMKAIVAFEIEITSIEHVFKLSQNRDEKSYENIINHLKEQDADGSKIATEMKDRKNQIFPG